MAQDGVPDDVSREHGKEQSGSLKREEFIDQVNDYQLVKRDPAP
jgi:hypothetical protein